MLFEKWLLPDELLPDYQAVTPEKLRAEGIRWIFSDIDNTLVPHHYEEPPEEVVRWCRSMTEAGIGIVFVSNNARARVGVFNRKLGYPAYAKAKKPLTGVLNDAMKAVHATPGISLLLGDQLLTDAAAGRRAGMRVYIVSPVEDRKSLFFRLKRLIEKPYIKRMKQRQEPADETPDLKSNDNGGIPA